MAYVEFLRVRKLLAWHVCIIAVLALAVVALGSGHSASVHIDSGTGRTTLASGMSVPLGILASVASFFGAIFASGVGLSLNRESLTRDVSWTKPITRTRLAIEYVLTDLAGIAVAYAFSFVAMVFTVTRFNIAVYSDDTLPMQIVLGLGIGTMWYGLLQLITCWFSPTARAMSGILWPIALVLAGMASLGGGVGAVVRAIDVLNPLMYMSNSARSGTHSMHVGFTQDGSSLVGGIVAAPLDVRALLVWCFSLAFCALAIAIWPKKEA